jgi:hypothetical protein
VRRASASRSARTAKCLDAACGAAFLLASIVAHRPSEGALTSAILTVAIVESGWVAAALAFGLYEYPYHLGRAGLVTVFGVSVGLVLRTLIRWRALVPVFALVTFAVGAALVLGWRLVAYLAVVARNTRQQSDLPRTPP